MKKLAITAFLFSLLLFPGYVFAGTVLFEIPGQYGVADAVWGHSDSPFGLNVAEFIFSHGAGYPGVCEMGFWLAQSGNPTDDVVLSLYRDGIYTNNPTSQPLFAHSVISGASLPTSMGQKTVFKLDNCFDSIGLSDMWFVLSRTRPDSQGEYISQIIPYNMADNWGFSSFVPGRGWFMDQTKELRLSFESRTPATKIPVLIIPGIAGTELYNGTDFIWPNINQMFFNINADQFITDNLSLDNAGNSIKTINVNNVVESINDDIVTGLPIINTFLNLKLDLVSSGYSIGNDFFYFPYDWRLDLNNTKDYLKTTIDSIKSQTGASKINIIAHSMGGLMVKDYIAQYGKGDIDKLIFVGTPHLGAPKAGKVLLEGDDLGIPWLNPSRIKDVSDNSPASYELLPQQKYFDVFQGYIKSGLSLLNYTDTKSFLISQNLNSGLVANADSFFAKNLQDMDLSGVDTYNIVGCGLGTQAAYNYNRVNPLFFPKRIGYTSGDETVPLVSAAYINISANKKFYAKRVSHSNLPSQSSVRSAILNILSGQSVTNSGQFSTDVSLCSFAGKQLVWKSPVDVHIYDQNNNHSGPIEGGLENSIPGVDYEIIDGHKFIFLPTNEGQQYRVEGTGTASGSFDLTITDNNNGQEGQTHVFNDVGIITGSRINFNVFGTSTDSQINFDYNNGGQFSLVNASSILSSGQIDDLTPPVTTAIVSGLQGLNGWHKSSVVLTLNALDDNSGILETKYSINKGPFISYISPISVTQEGISNIRYYSVDRAGNDEDIKALEVKIDTIAPEFEIKFDTNQKALVITSSDSISCTSTACTANDQAGNNSILKFGKTVIGAAYLLSLKSVAYNGQIKDLSSNIFVVNFLIKNGQISIFHQMLLVKNQEIAGIHYDPKTSRSMIITYKNGALSKEIVVGIRFLRVDTDKGIIKISS